MKIVTWNINGYRSAEKNNNLKKIISKSNPDIICLQEIKMNEKVLDNPSYNCYYNFANKLGYSGVMILTKKKPLKVIDKLGIDRFDQEGRFT